MNKGPDNIEQFVVSEVIAYIDDKNRDKRTIESLYDNLSKCLFCQGKWSGIPTGNCTSCNLYLTCGGSGCEIANCGNCNRDFCKFCATECFSWTCDDHFLCGKCSDGLICIRCKFTACSEHPLKITELPNGYKAPLCQDCFERFQLKPHDFNFSSKNMIEFYGILHKRQKWSNSAEFH